jgi:hypothetical protein
MTDYLYSIGRLSFAKKIGLDLMMRVDRLERHVRNLYMVLVHSQNVWDSVITESGHIFILNEFYSGAPEFTLGF